MEDKSMKLFELADELRMGAGDAGADNVLIEARKRGLRFELRDLHGLLKNNVAGGIAIDGTVVHFIVECAKRLNPRKMLDPWPNHGQLIIPALQQVSAARGYAVEANSQRAEAITAICSPESLIWKVGDPMVIIPSLDEEFDFVVCCPPIGHRQRSTVSLTGSDGTIEVRGALDNLLVLQACTKLSEDGSGLFILPSRVFFNRDKGGLWDSLERLGMCIDACVYVRAGLSNTPIDTYIARVKRGRSPTLFVAKLTAENQDNPTLIDNMLSHSASNDISLGRLVDAKEFRGIPALEEGERYALASKAAQRAGMRPVALRDVGTVNLAKRGETPSFEDLPNSVYLPLIGRSNAITSMGEATLKHHNYAQIVLNPEYAYAPYVARFLNTPLGMIVRERGLRGEVIPKMNKQSVWEMTLFLPDIGRQFRQAEASLNALNLMSELDELEKAVWDRPEELDETIAAISRFRSNDSPTDWVATLPFPLATILWAYHAASEERDKNEHLLHFFEAMTEFLAIVMLSAFRSQTATYEAVKAPLNEILRRNGHTLEIASFGAWKIVLEFLSKKTRNMINGEEDSIKQCHELYKTDSKNVLNMLSSKELVRVVQETNTHRNRGKGHAGIESPAITKQLHLDLQRQLHSVRMVFGTNWSEYQLIKLIHSVPQDDRIINLSHKLMGINTPFEERDYETIDTIRGGKLYLLTPNHGKALELLPFVKVMASPQTEQNACYFFNRVEKDGIRFVSYHFAQEAELKNQFVDTASALMELSGKEAQLEKSK